MDQLRELMESEPQSEVSLIRALSANISENALVYLGNSLPIREWDMAAIYEPRGHEIAASRGLNGIDGQLSTFFGLSHANRENWGIFGDLTTLYDLAAPWILPELTDLSIRVVVINNKGGRIFKRMFKDPVFQNIHEYEFEHFAKMWNLPYERLERIPVFEKLPKHVLLEVCPCPLATQRFWNAYDEIKQAICC